MSNLPRGIRNHNPGNIERGDPWQGLAPDQSSDPRFCVFISPEWGIRAIARTLITYQDRHGIYTIRGIVNRWAPPSENDSGSYISHMAGRVGIGPDDELDITDYKTARSVVESIIIHENGRNPDAADDRWYSDLVINRGLELAGIEAPVGDKAHALDKERPLPETRTVKGGQVAAAGGAISVIGAAVEQFSPAFPMMQTAMQAAPWVVGVLVLVGVAIVVGARLDDRRKGMR